MATIEPYDAKSGRRYRVRYRTPDHRQTTKRGFKTKRDAEAFANTVEVQKLTGDYVAPALGRITVAELAPAWLERKESDVARLAHESRRHRTLVLTLAYTGLRWGEAVALKVRDVEFLRRRITVHDNAVQLGVDHAEGLTKSRRTRSVPAPQFVLDVLSQQCAGKSPTDLVFPGPDGRYLPRPKSDGGWFVGAVKRAQVQQITPHDLRHTTASLAVSAGVNVLALARMLGHTSAKVTLDTYADLFDTDLDAVAVTMNDAYSPASVVKVWSNETA